jgi:TonB family protein
MSKQYWQVMAIAVAVIFAGTAWAAQLTKIIKAPDSWKPTEPRMLDDTSFSAAPADGAGCVIVGYHILRNGTVAKARVMQGAFTGGTPEAVQKAFTEAALAAAAGWEFRYVGRFAEPEPEFEWTVLGYGRAGRGQPRKAIVGVDEQDDRVRAACQLERLADWGKRQAVAVEAVPDHKDRILFPYEEPANAFWVVDGDMMPPRYPVAAASRRIQGCVVVGAMIGKEGKATQFRVMRSMTSRSDAKVRKLFENASVQAVAQWRFAPGPDNPARVPAFLQFPIDFLLDSHAPMKACQPVDVRAENRAAHAGV